jgi:hypothetical protein
MRGLVLSIVLVGCSPGRAPAAYRWNEGAEPSVSSDDPATWDAADQDGDGASTDDCDDGDPALHPGASDDVGDGVDQNCDGLDGVDADGDGFASFRSGGDDCEDDDAALNQADADGDGFTTCNGDCDDLVAEDWPGNIEVCDGFDNDCDLVVDVSGAGAMPCARDDEFVSWDATDVLIVEFNQFGDIDDYLETDVDELLTPLVGVGSIHVGVISTGMGDEPYAGKLQGVDDQLYIDDSFDLVSAIDFLSAAVHPLGTGNQGMEAVWTADAVYGDSSNAGFFRDDSFLSILFVSSQDDGSALLLTSDFYQTWLSFTKPANLLAVNAIDVPPAGCAGPYWFWATPSPGDQYDRLVADYSGASFPICDLDFASDLATVAAEAVPAAGVFALSDIPETTTLSIIVSEPLGRIAVPISGVDWNFDPALDAVVFTGSGYWPPAGSQVGVTYSAMP